MTQPDSTEVARLLAGRLIERRDVKATQQRDGAYHPVRDQAGGFVPLRLNDLVEHVDGARTIGHYVVSAENKCRIFAFDIDLVKLARTESGQAYAPRAIWLGQTTPAKRELAVQLATMAEELAIRTSDLLNLPVAVSYSGAKGMHVIAMLDPGTSAQDARNLAQIVLDSFDGDMELTKGSNFFRHRLVWQALEVELFPKQDMVRSGDGLGNLLRLPLGVNQKTGQQSWFLDLSRPACDFVKLDPTIALTRGSR